MDWARCYRCKKWLRDDPVRDTVKGPPRPWSGEQQSKDAWQQVESTRRKAKSSPGTSADQSQSGSGKGGSAQQRSGKGSDTGGKQTQRDYLAAAVEQLTLAGLADDHPLMVAAKAQVPSAAAAQPDERGPPPWMRVRSHQDKLAHFQGQLTASKATEANLRQQITELEQDLEDCVASQAALAESVKKEEEELQRLHRRAALHPAGDDCKAAVNGLVETLFGHLPESFRVAKADQLRTAVDLLGDLAAAGASFQEQEEARRKAQAEEAAQRAMSGSGPSPAPAAPSDSRVAEDCKQQLTELLEGGQAGQYEGLYRTMLDFLQNPSALSKRPRRDAPGPEAAAAAAPSAAPGPAAADVPADVPMPADRDVAGAPPPSG